MPTSETGMSNKQKSLHDKPMDNIRKIIHIDMDAFFAAVEQRDKDRKSVV